MGTYHTFFVATDAQLDGLFPARALRPLKALAIEAARRGGRVCHYYAPHY